MELKILLKKYMKKWYKEEYYNRIEHEAIYKVANLRVG